MYLPPGYDIDADRLVYAAFGEASLPLAANFEASLALRYERYPNQGLASLDPKLALRWQAAPSLALRASAGTAFRAPTINQIEPGIATTSRQFVGRIATFKPILALGNPALEPEAATTFNVGAVLDRDGVFVGVDYWRYAFEKPLVLEPYVQVLDAACPPALALCDPASPYFDRIDFGGRAAVSDISAISVSVVNGPDVATDGVDLTAEYKAATDWGEWSAGLKGTRTLSWKIAGWRFGSAYDAIGRLNYDTSLARTVVDWKAKAWLAARFGDVNVRWTARHAAAYLHDSDAEPGIGAHTTHDLMAAWTVAAGRFTLAASVANIADEPPPRVYRQINYDPLTHSPMGRIVQFGLRWRR
jgi:iron complex outermembrane receptor protein